MAAVRSAYKTSIALAGAAAIAVSPLIPDQDTALRTVTLPQIQLTDLTIPAIGAIPYQIGINALGNILALAPILIGSTEQCQTVCLGPNTPSPAATYAPFTGWGLVGLGVGLITSPIALVKALEADKNLGQALGAALLDIQVPITNTFNLLLAPRVPLGGFALDAALQRVFTASRDALVAGYDIVAQALVTGPVAVIGGVVAGATAFAGTLAQTGDVITALNAGRAPIEQSVNAALTDLTIKIDTGRARVYADLTEPPGVATSPIPTVPPAGAAASAVKVVTSAKAVPGTTARAAAATDGNSSAKAPDDAGAASHATTSKSGVGGSKRQHKAASGD
ncbi:hypothetical protein BayCH28_21900 [Mycolicibacterium sp. CH28]|uniref:hypothetical protein n=1 Tax=Mycolicibacterium sp. CH28 TaxID=2512237 RepID=UPI00107FF6B6|nr:hypothetical protein [Mycolicibacterium sp. CH28]TGD85671.1 hypothetical protein BayCH28_21900 [Mycolicibacterium sp. CH28]